ncbi:Scr1 family TA system antitoxin-like transcriptional regulator [Streptomyces coelicoflavus]|uniref:Scr1 family TA system antitoxin-like transcriptional regulator n=1 Tax=Streptomyces coelicoflavus TaxID=285562 RepID=UPI003A87F1D8
MRGQLRHLLAVMPLASISLGIIPFTAQRTVWPLEAFYVHDDTMAVVETLTAEIKVTQPREAPTTPRRSPAWRRWPSTATPPAPSSRPRSTPWSELPQ